MINPRRFLAALTLAAVTLTACGSDDSTSSSPTSAPAGSTSAAPASDAPATSAAPAGTDAPAASSGSGSDVVPDPCSLLDAADISTALGLDAPQPELVITPEPPLFLAQCDWSAEPTELSLKSISLSVTTTAGLAEGGAGGGDYTARDQFDGLRGTSAGAVDVAGIGDAAFSSTSEGTDLHVIVGDTLVEIMTLKLGSEIAPFTAEQVQALAVAALARL